MKNQFILLLIAGVTLNGLVSRYGQAQPETKPHNFTPYQTETPVAEANHSRQFMDRMGYLEGSGNYRAVSRSGTYIGKYQFGPLAFKEVGHTVDRSRFRRNPDIFPEHVQDELFLKLCLVNKTYLQKEIEKYSGRTIKGVRITKAGMLAAAHLVGYHSVKRFLHSKGRVDRADGNGKRCSDYMREFQHFADHQLDLTGELDAMTALAKR